MKLFKVDELRGGEILAKAIMTEEFRVLLYEETQLRPEYINKIKELGVSEVYIKEDELLEITPINMRIRKKILDPVLRMRSRIK